MNDFDLIVSVMNRLTFEGEPGLRSDLRSKIKILRTAVQGGKAEAGALMADVESKLDKAAKRNVIPHGRANRLKGRLKRGMGKAPAAAA
jgi:ribosomal protein S20